jgi:hypothetical protein
VALCEVAMCFIGSRTMSFATIVMANHSQLVGFTTWSFGLGNHVVISNHRWHMWLDFCSCKCHFLALCITQQTPLPTKNKWQPNQHNDKKYAHNSTTQNENELFSVTWISTFVIFTHKLHFQDFSTWIQKLTRRLFPIHWSCNIPPHEWFFIHTSIKLLKL